MLTSRLRLLTAGESHGPEIVTILEGIPAGLSLTPEQINLQLARRQRGYGAGPRMKIERDEALIAGGVMAGVTTGAPIAIRILNRDHEKWRGAKVEAMTAPRPGHVDLAAAAKYGYDDLRPGLERSSARETAARVAAGAVCALFLAEFGIRTGGYVAAIGETKANLGDMTWEERFTAAESSDVRCPDTQAAQRMKVAIRQAMDERDTLGGVLEVAATGLPPGLGSHVQWDRRLEARIGAAFLSVQAIKGVEIGYAFETARLSGTRAHDAIRLAGRDLVRESNRAGGLEGGITNGRPLVVRAAMKPVATTLTPQATVDLAEGVETETRYERSDFCPVPRAVPILETVLAHVLADALLEKVGGDSMDEIRPRVEGLRTMSLDDLRLSREPKRFW